jgi:hypothetical protein
MGVRFTIDKSARLVAYVVEGDATLNEARAFLDAVLAHSDFERGFNFLGDRRDVNRAPSATYIHSLSHTMNARRVVLGPCRWAVVVADEAGYEMARIWEQLTGSSAIEVEPFRTPEEATAWLGLPQACAPLLLVPVG